MTGTVKWFNRDNGYGFITPDNGTAEVFVHYTAIQGVTGRRNLAEGQQVMFEVVRDEKGRTRAENVIPGRYADVKPYREG
jgi:CspA family cold shock protein